MAIDSVIVSESLMITANKSKINLKIHLLLYSIIMLNLYQCQN